MLSIIGAKRRAAHHVTFRYRQTPTYTQQAAQLGADSVLCMCLMKFGDFKGQSTAFRLLRDFYAGAKIQLFL